MRLRLGALVILLAMLAACGDGADTPDSSDVSADTTAAPPSGPSNTQLPDTFPTEP